MSDVTPPAGDLPPPPPGEPGAQYWQQSPASGGAPSNVLLPPPPSQYTDAPTTRAIGLPSRPVAGFWRRLWARIITGVVWLAALQVGTYVIATLFLFIDSAAPNTAVPVAGLVVSWAYGLLVTYLAWSRPLVAHHGTLGMRQMGLSIHGESARSSIRGAQAFRRNLIPLVPFVVASGCAWLWLFTPDDDLIALALVIESALVLLTVLGGLWMFANPRRQTVWDVVGDTVVVIDREPSWLSVTALVTGLLVPLGAAVTLAVVGADRLQSEYRKLSGVGSAGRYLVYNIPTLALSLCAIILGHLAIRSTQWDSHVQAGRGLARTAQFLGYLFPVALVLTLGFGAVYRQLEDRQERSCTEIRADVGIAAESYRQLNGFYPSSISTLGEGIYLNDPDLAEAWTLTTTPDPTKYELVGKGDCAKA